MLCSAMQPPLTADKVGRAPCQVDLMHQAVDTIKTARLLPVHLPPRRVIGCHPPAPLTLFQRRSPANMKPLLVRKSDPTMLIAVDRLPENTNPDT